MFLGCSPYPEKVSLGRGCQTCSEAYQEGEQDVQFCSNSYEKWIDLNENICNSESVCYGRCGRYFCPYSYEGENSLGCEICIREHFSSSYYSCINDHI